MTWHILISKWKYFKILATCFSYNKPSSGQKQNKVLVHSVILKYSTRCYPKFLRILIYHANHYCCKLAPLGASTISQPTGIFIRARVSELWLFSLHRFHVYLLISKLRMSRSKEFSLNFASSSTKLQLKPTECYTRPLVSKL